MEPPPTGRQQRQKGKRQQSLSPDQQYDADLAAAVSASLGGVKGQRSSEQAVWDDSYDMDLATAISMSMQGEVCFSFDDLYQLETVLGECCRSLGHGSILTQYLSGYPFSS